MSITSIIESVNKVWSRVFDHRGFLNGEINFFVREFEQKRGDEEVDSLFKIIENITEIKCTHTERVKQAITQTLPDCIEEVEKSLALCNQLLELENKYKDEDALLACNKEIREIREADWKKFMDKITPEHIEVNSAFEKNKEQLKHCQS